MFYVTLVVACTIAATTFMPESDAAPPARGPARDGAHPSVPNAALPKSQSPHADGTESPPNTNLSWDEELIPLCPSGESSRISSVAVDGLVHTDPKVVLREIDAHRGDTLSCDVWKTERRRLHGLDIFADASLYGKQASDGVGLIYRFRELPVFVPYPAIRRTDQDGWLFGGGVTSVNVLGQAIRVDLAARGGVAPIWGKREIILYTASRWLANRRMGHELWVQLLSTYNVLKRFDERSAYATLELYPSVAERIEAVVAAGILGLRHTQGAVRPFLGDRSADVIPHLGLGLRRDGRDDPADARSGTYAELRLTQHGGFLGGAAQFREYLFDLRAITSVAARHVGLATGLIRHRHGRVPFYEALHVGGPNTLRGYQPNPERSGNSELLASVEYRYVLANRTPWTLLGQAAYTGIQICLGADLAMQWDDAPFADARRYGAAFAGVHLLLPGVQRLRIELGIQEDGRTMGLTVGIYERSSIQRWRVR